MPKQALGLNRVHRLARLGLLLTLLVAGCAAAEPAAMGPAAGRLQVVATTTVIGDIVREVGGDALDLSVILPAGADPHSFEPAPQDVAMIATADVVFVNGLGFEGPLLAVIENSAATAHVVELSAGVDAIPAAAEPEEAEAADEDGRGQFDPHVWFDPQIVGQWTAVIEQTLAELAPAQADGFTANAGRYRQQLQELDQWIAVQVAQIPAERRLLVTEHNTLAYFARRYSFEVAGVVIPGASSLAEPSAQELVELTNHIRDLGVPAIFVGTTLSPKVAEQVAAETGARLVAIYTDSLSDSSGPAATYLELMRVDVERITAALATTP